MRSPTRISLVPNTSTDPVSVAVVIPCFRVAESILDVLSRITADVSRIYVVDDASPDNVGDLVARSCTDERVVVLRNEKNLGVGGAVVAGYRQALADGAEIIVKLDGDGQMEPRLIPRFIKPIQDGRADYTKGNRFYAPETLKSMPLPRLLGNALLCGAAKISTGYWDIMDPTNGLTAIHAAVLRLLPLEKIERGYLFETDMLLRLNTVRAVVLDIPMRARYGSEVSSLSLRKAAIEFPRKHVRGFLKRVVYNYFVREFNIGTIELFVGLVFLFAGTAFGTWKWYWSIRLGVPATSGTVMLAGLFVLVGFQLLLSAMNYDISNTPRQCLHNVL